MGENRIRWIDSFNTKLYKNQLDRIRARARENPRFSRMIVIN